LEYYTLLALLVAEIAKIEAAREQLTVTMPFLLNLFIHATRPLQASSKRNNCDKLVIQCLRSIANLCYNNEPNRDILCENEEAVNALALTLTSENHDVVYTACGAVLNTSMDNGIQGAY
jgi:hypothetical protein